MHVGLDRKHSNQPIPCFLNHSYLLVEINEFDQLFLQYFLSANSLFDERVLEEVQHIRSQLKVLNQTSVKFEEGKGGGMSAGQVVFKAVKASASTRTRKVKSICKATSSWQQPNVVNK